MPPAQTGVLLPAEGVAGSAFIVITIAVEVADAVVTQPPVTVISQVTELVFARFDEVKVARLEPTLPPFTFHW